MQQKKSKERRKLVDLEDAFREADKSRDGRLTVEEWCEVLAKTGNDNPRYTVKKRQNMLQLGLVHELLSRLHQRHKIDILEDMQIFWIHEKSETRCKCND